MINQFINKIHHGNSLNILKEMPDNSVDTVITSPPYWQLRNYGYPDQWGLEPTYQEYLEHLWSLMDETYRILKPTGTAWINLGDTYGTVSGRMGSPLKIKNPKLSETAFSSQDFKQPKTIHKCLLLIPHRFAIGCIDRNWIVRNDIIWAKRNGMPESCRDRFSKKHEYFFLMVKSNRVLCWYHSKREIWTWEKPVPDYYYRNNLTSEISIKEPPDFLTAIMPPPGDTKIPKEDSEIYGSPRGRYHREKSLWKKLNYWESHNYYFDLGGIREKGKPLNRWGGPILKATNKSKWDAGTGQNSYRNRNMQPNNGMKNPSDVSDFWNIPTSPSTADHYASYNFKLIEKPIIAGCPEGGIVLDPFCGVGTTLIRALQLGRRVIGIDGSSEYCEIARKKIGKELNQLKIFA